MADLDPYNAICKRCGLTWGAHRADPKDESCPAHEGRMDFAQNTTVFLDSGENRPVPAETPAKNISKEALVG